MAQNLLITDEMQVWKHMGRPVEFEYRTDNNPFDNPPDCDRWQKPDYYDCYHTNNNKCECEDFSGVSTCIMEAKGIPVEVIGIKRVSRQQLSFPQQGSL